MTETSVQTIPQEVAVSEGAVVLSMLERALFDTSIDLDRAQALMNMQRQMRQEAAEIEYTNSMADAQSEMEPVRADQYNEQTKSKYASYAALDRAIRPIYTKHGFVLDFNTEPSKYEDMILIVCTCSHRSGHKRVFNIDMPTDGKGPKGTSVMTKTHATKSAISYGKTTLVGMAFNLAVDKDDDGNAAGNDAEIITDEQRDQLLALIDETEANVEKFCTLFKVETVADIPMNKFGAAVKRLQDRKALREQAKEREHADH